MDFSSTESDWDKEYKPLPAVFGAFLALWTCMLGLWVWNTWSRRQWQSTCLQWALSALPALKCSVLILSLLFWYWCLHMDVCSFWVAFGVFVSRIFFETCAFICFMLIANGFGITEDTLSSNQRRCIAGFSALLYVALSAYKAALPNFQLVMACVYTLLLYSIFSNVARRLGALQHELQHMLGDGAASEDEAERESSRAIVCALQHKCTLFRRFQLSMLVIVMAELLLHAKAEMLGPYWLSLVLRESFEVSIFFFLGWTFRAQPQSAMLTLLPVVREGLPPIHRIDMDAAEFKSLQAKNWSIGVRSVRGKGVRGEERGEGSAKHARAICCIRKAASVTEEIFFLQVEGVESNKASKPVLVIVTNPAAPEGGGRRLAKGRALEEV